MRKVFCIFSMLVSVKLQAISCFGNQEPARATVHIEPKAAFETSSSEALEPFTEIGTLPTGVGPLDITYSQTGKFAAVANGTGTSIFVYKVDCETGLFTLIQTVTTDFIAQSVSYAPCDAYAAVAADSGTSQTSNNVTIYSVDCTTGEWTLIQTLQFPEVDAATTLDYSPDGRFLAITNYNGFLSIYKVSKITGKVILSDQVSGVDGFADVAFSPDGKFLAVILNASGDVAIYRVDPVTGSLTFITSESAGIAPFRLAWQHDGKFLAVVSPISNSVFVFQFDQVSGDITPSQTILSINRPLDVAFSPDDSLASVVNRNPGAATTLFCVVDGTWQTPATQTIPSTLSVGSVTFSPCEGFAATTSSGPTLTDPGIVTIYKVDDSVCQP